MADKYLPFEQDGVEYNLYEMPKGFVIKGNVDLCHKCLTELPDLSEVVVEGNFWCSNNQLTSLEGAPQKVGGEFYCSNNQLTTLEGAPKEVGGDFYCDYNKLTTLEGAPQKVGGSFDCSSNQLASLFGVPPLKGNNRIVCDDVLRGKYGFFDSEDDGFTFKQLSESTLYKSEVAADNVRRKQQQQERAEKQQQATEKTKAAFDAWLKNKGIEPPAR